MDSMNTMKRKTDKSINADLEELFIELQLELSGKNRDDVILQITEDMREIIID